MNPRILEFITGIETTPQPDAGAPSDPNDVLTLAFAESRAVVGTTAAPSDVPVGGLDVSAEAASKILAFVRGSGGAIDVTHNPQIIHDLPIGGSIELRGCSDANTLKLDNGTGLVLTSDSIVLKSGSVIRFFYNGTNLEESYRNGVEA